MLLGLRVIRRCPAPPLRLLSTTHNAAQPLKPAIHMLAQIRHQRIGIPLSLAKRALVESNNDLDKALAWLDVHSVQTGTKMAKSLADRATNQGLVAVYNGPSYLNMIQVLCETDFVARTDLFKDLALQIAAAAPTDQPSPRIQARECSEISRPGSTVARQVVECIGKLGENITLDRAVSILKTADLVIGSYVHGDKDQRAAGIGSIGALVAVSGNEPLTTMHLSLAHELAKLVVGYNPLTINELRQIPYSPQAPLPFSSRNKLENLTVADVLNGAGCQVSDYTRFQIGTK